MKNDAIAKGKGACLIEFKEQQLSINIGILESNKQAEGFILENINL